LTYLSTAAIYTLSLHDALPILFKTLAAGAERAETRVLAYSTSSPLAAVIRPESITVSGDAPTAGRTVEAIRLRQSPERIVMADEDRKSTRLNSSHVKISYAVFC